MRINQNQKHFLPEFEVDNDLENLQFTEDQFLNDLNHYEIFLKKINTSPHYIIHNDLNKYSQSNSNGLSSENMQFNTKQISDTKSKEDCLD